MAQSKHQVDSEYKRRKGKQGYTVTFLEAYPLPAVLALSQSVAQIHMDNKAFWKAIRLLCQPASLTAMGLLLINDHLLRQLWPSWWTGKMGDLAWLLFFPFLLAVLLAWLIPPQLSHQDKIVKWLAFGLTGGIFTLAKTLPAFHSLTIRSAETLLGIPISLQRDPTDLIALISLTVSWRLWERQLASRPSCLPSAWLALPLAALLTIANAAIVEDHGIASLSSEGQTVIARSRYRAFVSADGGLSWHSEAQGHGLPVDIPPGERRISDPDDPNIQYRFTPGVAIERSEDGGQTWHHEFSISPIAQSARAHYEKLSSNPRFWPGPLDALIDPVTGNAIFAMGHEGVLVRQANAEWVWAPVGEYRRLKFDQVGAMASLLIGEALLALDFGLLSVLTLTRRNQQGSFRKNLVRFGWVLWGLNAIAFPPALNADEMWGLPVLLDYMLLGAGALLVGFLALKDVLAIAQRSRQALSRLAVAGLGGMVLFFLPYVFWAFNILRHYTAAVLFAFGLGAVTLLVGSRATHERLESARGE